MGLSKNQAVSSAKLIRQAQARGLIPKSVPHAGTILVGTQRVTKPKKNGLATTFVSGSDWSFDLDAGLLVDAITTSLLTLYRQAIQRGLKPDGSGAHPPLKAGAAMVKNRKGKTRGYRTGYLADNLRRSKITGTTTKAQSRIVPPVNRNVFVATEAKRGHSYTTVSGMAATVIQTVTDKFIRDGLVNRNRAADRSERSGKSK